MTILRLLPVLLLMLAVFSPAVHAEDAAPPAAEEKAAEEAAPEEAAKEPGESKSTPGRQAGEKAKRLQQSMSRFVMNLEPAQMQHFYLTYNNYNLIRTVDEVRTSVSKAVDACSENNPDMESKLRGRFGKWSDALKPFYEEADANLNNMIIAQDYAEPEKIKGFFKQVDDARDEKNNQFDKVPVTTPEACEYMLGKMDETQDTLLSLLRATLISFPKSLPGYVPPAEEKEG